MTLEISLNGVDVSGLALDSSFKTKNTEILSIIVAKIIGQMAAAGMVLDDGQLSQTELNAIWEKQDAVLTKQIAYLESVGLFFQKKSERMPQQTNWLSEFLKWVAQALAARAVYVATANALGPFADVAGEIVYFGVGYAIDQLGKTYTQGILLTDAMMAENNSLLALTPSRKNYELRSMIISQHDRSIGNILAHAAQLEERIAQDTIGNDEEWQDWLENMNDTGDDLEHWIDDGMDAEVSLLDNDSSNDLPVPIAPRLPAVPFPKLPSRRSELPAIIIGEVVKVGGRALLKYLKKSMEQKNFARQNDLIDAIKELKYNNEEVDFGAFRYNLRTRQIYWDP